MAVLHTDPGPRPYLDKTEEVEWSQFIKRCIVHALQLDMEKDKRI